jgi:hypothetical protein
MESRKNSTAGKTDLLNLISQSFQTNLNILSYLEKSGIQFDNNDWNQLLKTQNGLGEASMTSYPIPQPPNQLGTAPGPNRKMEAVLDMCQSKNQHDQLCQINDRIDTLLKKNQELRGQIVQFEKSQAETKDILVLEEDENHSSARFDEKIREIEEHILKLKEFETNHLTNYIISLKERILGTESQIKNLNPSSQHYDRELQR